MAEPPQAHHVRAVAIVKSVPVVAPVDDHSAIRQEGHLLRNGAVPGPSNGGGSQPQYNVLICGDALSQRLLADGQYDAPFGDDETRVVQHVIGVKNPLLLKRELSTGEQGGELLIGLDHRQNKSFC